MNKKKPLRGSASMRPRARLIGLIGEELISDEPVALVELVKNAYDADATCVGVHFEGPEPDRPESIVVVDDGIGMDLETVLTGWFEPGTVLKRKFERSPGGRYYQGAKGIGRFAAARLAEALFLESKKENKDQGVSVLLDWGKFDDESYLDEITIDYEVVPMADLDHGTRLTLEGVRKTWDESDYEELFARMSRLMSPFEDVRDFRIHLEIPGYPQFSGDVQPPELILRPKYLLRGKLDASGYFTGELLVDGTTIKKHANHKIAERDSIPLCGSFEVEIRAWDRDPEGLGPIVERHGKGIREIRGILDTYCGVNIYRDGFRVYPYGQRGNDWLNLDIRSRLNPVIRLANNQIVAAIKISRQDNPDLRDRSTREGMVLNAAHSNLEESFTRILSLLEEERYGIRPRQQESSDTDVSEPLFEAFDLHPTVQTTIDELGKNHPVTTLIQDTEKQVSKGVKRLQEVYSRLLMSAGLGHMVDLVIHEIGSPLGKINRQLLILEGQLLALMNSAELREVSTKIDSIKGWLEQIHNLRQRLDPQTPAKRGRATTFDVREEVEDNFHLYEALIVKQKIKYDINSTERSLRVKMSRACLGQILVNLIDNSIYWLTRDKGSGNGGQIHVCIEPLEHGFRVLYSDDGPGVPDNDEAKIFEPYFTKKPNGMGLGLYICRLLIEPYGRLVYRNDRKETGAHFEARFERSVGR